MSFVLGVTGGIATGKTTVVDIFRSHSFPIVDGDVVARKVVEPNEPGLAAIVAHFGPTILLPDGCLNRKRLGQIIFNDETQRKCLNEILNPFIRQEILDQMEAGKKNSPLVIADVPLMYEGHYDQYMDEVAVVYVDEATQIQRLMKRDLLTEAEALSRISSQWPIEKKKALADIVFDNRGTKEDTKQAVEAWLSEKGFI